MSSLTLIMLVLVGLMVVGVAGSVLSARWYGHHPRPERARAATPTARREALCSTPVDR